MRQASINTLLIAGLSLLPTFHLPAFANPLEPEELATVTVVVDGMMKSQSGAT